jgi:hypothetical protein
MFFFEFIFTGGGEGWREREREVPDLNYKSAKGAED